MISTTGQTQFYQNKGFNYGWICPKCGSVYAPTQIECYKCSSVTKCELTSTTIALNDYEKWKETKTYYGGNNNGKHSNE